MVYFPQLANGIRAQRPYQHESAFLNVSNDLDCGVRYSQSNRTDPLSKWTLQYPSLSDDDLATLEAFFNAQQGRFGQWCWLDPIGNLIPNSESYVTGLDDPEGGFRAGLATSLSQEVLPSDAAGIMLTTSVWVKPATTTSYTIGFTGSTSTYSVSAGWRKISHTGTVSGSGPINATVTSGVTRQMYGFQCSVLSAAGPYIRTPGPGFALHPIAVSIKTISPCGIWVRTNRQLH